MRFQEDFGLMLAFALAIHRRDEVATGQFCKMISNAVINDHEEAEMLSPRSRGERSEELLNERMAERMKNLSGLVDKDGMAWLKTQIKH